ncbi:hypothetical protein SCOR_08295 [Sulfidibacter corallicola]|uniref:Uncharacterized protein n=1 Tax=Sulfidibacter corallicola TaxID=2818388 RepID=A0A8A4TQ81_SULCO|nr:hypothetical protein [Sulfidibacter corallicola]QTD51242.1 hypothetical protein J3U87_02130 [Sulfidibacter corallicola]
MIDQILGSSPVLNTNAVSPVGQALGASQNAEANSGSRFDTEDSVTISSAAIEAAGQNEGTLETERRPKEEPVDL